MTEPLPDPKPPEGSQTSPVLEARLSEPRPRRVRYVSGRFAADGKYHEREITKEEADRSLSMYRPAANLPDPNQQEDA